MTAAPERLGTHEILPLRAAVLRRDTPSSDPRFPEDDLDGTIHLAIRDAAGVVIATSTWLTRPFPHEPDLPALQLRGMATATHLQGSGLGATLVEAGIALAREQGAELVWARARDTALGFYESAGFTVVGDGFVDATTELPHHLVLRRI